MGVVHICGLGGIGVSGVARLLHALDYVVRGSDRRRSVLTEELEALGIEVAYETRTDWARSADFILVANLFPPTHPELVAAREAGVPILGRSAVLAKLSQRHAKTSCLCMGTRSRGLLARMLAASIDGSGYCAGAATRDGQANAQWGSPFFIDIDERDFIDHKEDPAIFEDADVLISDWADIHHGYYPKTMTIAAFLASLPQKGRRIFPAPTENPNDNHLSIVCQDKGREWRENFEIQATSSGYRLHTAEANGRSFQFVSGTRADISALAVASAWLKMSLANAQQSSKRLFALAQDAQKWPIAYFERRPQSKHHLDVRMHPVSVGSAIAAARELNGAPLFLAFKPYASTLRAYEYKIWAEVLSPVSELVIILPPYEGCETGEIVKFINFICHFGLHCRSLTLETLHTQAKPNDNWLFIGAPDIVKGFS